VVQDAMPGAERAQACSSSRLVLPSVVETLGAIEAQTEKTRE